jgi:phage terminase Nu1 subunit (DNA packaging protein)
VDSKKEKQEREAVAAVAERLKKKFPDLPKSHIDEIVQAQYSRLGEARLRDYIPVLVEHDSKQVINREEKSRKAKKR